MMICKSSFRLSYSQIKFFSSFTISSCPLISTFTLIYFETLLRILLK